MLNENRMPNRPVYLETRNMTFIKDERKHYGANSTQERTMTYDELKPRVAGITVEGLDGRVVALESLWRGRRVVLVFLRHFG